MIFLIQSLHKYSFLLLVMFGLGSLVLGQNASVPASYSNIKEKRGLLTIEYQGDDYVEVQRDPLFTLSQAKGNPRGTKKGIAFDFGDSQFFGTLYYGFIPYGDAQHPQPVYFKRTSSIEKGKAEINIVDQLQGKYDMIGWKEKGYGTLGYRVVGSSGLILYDGKVTFTGEGPLKVAPTLIEGPFVNKITSRQATISFETSMPVTASITIADNPPLTSPKGTHHEVQFDGFRPATTYSYTVTVGPQSETYEFTTAPVEGSRKPFVFAYASDSRAGQGGGERDVYGANFYIMKKIMALSKMKGISFFQFSGDMIDGYLTDVDEMNLQYANWKRAIEPFAHYFPVYISMGNHEALMRMFAKKGERPAFTIDRFPFESQSAEAVFAKNFVNPENGPVSEDGSKYDPDPEKIDFPSYKENVFYYTHDNVAVVVLNSDYWYAPSTATIPVMSGGMHGYIMDQQVEWLRQTIQSLEENDNIDHIFLTQHTPFFPNGGHVGDDMWYNGDNNQRPFITGKPVETGIIQRRDQLLDIVVNQSEKVIAILTGDEHNYAKTEIGPETVIYNDEFPESERITLKRTIYQINNGAAGAPYYAQEETPWSPFVSGFTTQNALVLFNVNGESIEVEVLNPDTLEEIERFNLR